ncbi:MAG: phosphoribosylformylglycinamidine cyclo-ligase, partial [Halioglobus sp.]|nr:phosphoribosylformylglycinamidine cyclo-ligase [Halioglobus sp.]
IGGETAEMPDMYQAGDYDLAGFCVGAVERSKLIDGSGIGPGDTLIGIASSGPHSNGYSLIRKVLGIARNHDIDGQPAESLLMTPTTIYVKPLLELGSEITMKGLAHITGGGLTENVPRILPEGVHAEISVNSWAPGPVFDWLATSGNIDADEMRRTFNCGIGMVVVVDSGDAGAALTQLSRSGLESWNIGEIVAGSGGVRYV